MIHQRVYAWLREYFSFSRSEARGLMVLLPLCVLSLFLPRFYQNHILNYPERVEAAVSLDSLYHLLELKMQTNQNQITYVEETSTLAPFPFDPNSISENDLIKIGIGPAIAKRIIKYRKKGGRFRNREDLGKIYGLDPDVLHVLLPFIEIKEVKSGKTFSSTNYKKKEKVVIPTDINLADTVQLKKIYGIGSVLSSRIVRYRESLGGFYSLAQLKEVYGIQDSVIIKLRSRFYVDSLFVPEKINLNTSTIDQLKSHPYVDYNLARVIVNYREMHGPFEHIEDLKKIHSIDDSIFTRLNPYFIIQ